MHHISINDMTIGVVRKKIKHLYLAIYPDTGKVRVAAPLKMSESNIYSFIMSKLPWIEKRKTKLATHRPSLPHQFVSGETHYFQGKCYSLNIIDQKHKSIVIRHDNAVIDLYAPNDTPLTQRQLMMTKWYCQQLKDQLPPLLEKWQKIIGVEITDCRIKQMKTRWGTCNIKARRIWINLELAKKPEYCLEYIIAHELVHLLERTHNHRFKAYMDKFMPDWRSYKRLLIST